MKNIKYYSRLIWKLWMYFCAFVVSLYALFYITLWAFFDFNPYFLSIDSCIDLGGVWDYAKNVCNK